MEWRPATIQIPAPPFLNVGEVAALSGLSTRTIRRRIAAGRFPEPCEKGKWSGFAVGVWLALQGHVRTPEDSESAQPAETLVKGNSGGRNSATAERP